MTPPLLSTQDLDHLHRMLPQEVGYKYDPVTQGDQREIYIDLLTLQSRKEFICLSASLDWELLHVKKYVFFIFNLQCLRQGQMYN